MRISPTPAIGLLASHTALVTGVHGITGDIVGTSDTQLLTNKTFRDNVIVENIARGTGVFSSPQALFKGGYDTTDLQMGIQLSPSSTTVYSLYFVDKDGVGKASIAYDGSMNSHGKFTFKSGTAFYLTMQHAITAARIVTWPDKAITVFGTVDEKVVQVIPLDELEISVGASALTNETGTEQGITQWEFDAANERIRTSTTFTPPAGFEKLKIEALLLGTNEANEFEFSYSLDGGAIISVGVWQGAARGVATSSEISVDETEPVRLFLEWNSATETGYCYGFKLIWYQ